MNPPTPSPTPNQTPGDLAPTPRCDKAPAGWQCTRTKGHEGPCAAEPVQPAYYGHSPRVTAAKCAASDFAGLNLVVDAELADQIENELFAATVEIESLRNRLGFKFRHEEMYEEAKKLLSETEEAKLEAEEKVTSLERRATAAEAQAAELRKERDHLKMHNAELDSLAVGAHAARAEIRNERDSATARAEQAEAAVEALKGEADQEAFTAHWKAHVPAYIAHGDADDIWQAALAYARKGEKP